MLRIAGDLESGVTRSRYDYGDPAFLGVALARAGTAVAGVYAGTPADAAGICAGDRLTAVGSTKVRTADQLHGRGARLSPGDRTSHLDRLAGASHTATSPWRDRARRVAGAGAVSGARASCAGAAARAPGVPTKPNSSRSRRSMKRRYAASSLPLVNSTNVGGAVEAWVPNRILRLLAAADRVRVLGDQPAEERVQRAGRDAGLPALERRVERRHQPVDVPAGAGGDVDPRRPLHPDQLALDLAVEVVAALLVDEVPLVEGDHQRPAGLARRR